MERLPCLICSVNITLIKTKGAYFFNLWNQHYSFCLKDFSMVYYCDLPVTNPVMIILQITFVKTFLVTGLVRQYWFFPKITIRAIIVVSSSAKFYHGTTIALFSSNPTFYQIYHHFRITVKVFFWFDKLRLNVYF